MHILLFYLKILYFKFNNKYKLINKIKRIFSYFFELIICTKSFENEIYIRTLFYRNPVLTFIQYVLFWL